MVVVFDDVVGISEDDFAIVVVVFDDVVGISEDDFAVVVVVHVFDDVSVADGCGDAVLLISFPEPDSYSETQCVWTVHNRVSKINRSSFSYTTHHGLRCNTEALPAKEQDLLYGSLIAIMIRIIMCVRPLLIYL